jgi:glycosyltransferase involved in cell wall biosynthesis
MRKILLIAFHYPPFGASSGLQRTLSFSIYLRRHGWQPYVLTVRPEVFESTSPEQLQDIPADVEVRRTTALDVARALSIKGRYWSRLALPDRWASWWLSAVPAGLSMIRRNSIDAIWSTYPVATAHWIGATLSRLTGRPWIADFRDPMVEWIASTGKFFPESPALRNARLKIEARAARHASRLVFCTDSAREIALRRYPALEPTKAVVIANGYDERAFETAMDMPRHREVDPRRILLHSGTIYLGPDRDPSFVLHAIRNLADQGVISSSSFELRLRNPSHESELRQIAAKIGVQDLVSILPPLPYREALAEMLWADGLLLLQGETSNPAVPAKLYEYLRAHRPIVACVHPDGETARTLREVGVRAVAPLTESNAIASLIHRWFLNDKAFHGDLLPDAAVVSTYSRSNQAAMLADLVASVSD